MAKRFLEKKRDDGSVIYRVDRQKRTGEYVINKDSSQAKHVASIRFHDFDRLPTGLYSKGFGLTNAGSWILRSLGEEFGSKLRVTISASMPSAVKSANSLVKVIINHNRLTAANNIVRGIKKDRNDEIRGVIDAFLNQNFPTKFDAADATPLEYRPGMVADLLDDEKVIENLSEEDKDSLRAIFPSLIGEIPRRLRDQEAANQGAFVRQKPSELLLVTGGRQGRFPDRKVP